ncbi:FtsX-like permease family protein [Microbulbifer thermotolerans]|uniref:ABC transporter permease n=1 Tax=Microbulbifer thermotolerans TaxID=252514 RepID=UPI00224B1B18|nr:FtsX-like permease family protein [Microbulbifer thermotolerans]MCX2834543.1 FtsX-like permease family protein [Microbulbifer thermotolerans]MCX2841744.1 FtsX-like permease family protein [Microbulbifer thermotolerans]
MLPLKLLFRDWRGGELALIASALVLAVACVTAISHVTDRLARAMQQQSLTFLAAERVLRSSQPVDPAWLQEARERGLQTAQVVQFASMVAAGDQFQFASVKAAGEGYPLLGELEVRDRENGPTHQVQRGPAPGEAWVEPRLLPLLQLHLGESLQLGDTSLKITGLLEREPDRGTSLFDMGARVLVHLQDLPAAGVIQPGSRVRYHYLFAGDDKVLQSYFTWLKPQLTEHQRVIDLRDGQPRVATALERAERFLFLAGSLAVLLAGIAVGLAARRYGLRHTAYVAVMKSLGASRGKVLTIYLGQLTALTLLATAVGLLAGSLIQSQAVALMADVFPVEPPPSRWNPLLVGLATGFACALGFAVAPLVRLARTDPMQTLRRDWSNPDRREWLGLVLGPTSMLILIWWLSGSLAITAALFSGLALLVGGAALVNRLLVRGHLASFGGAWRIALGSLQRRAAFNTLLIAAFGTGLLAMLALVFARTALIDEWRMQLPEKAPNHFLLNIAPHEVEDLRKMLADNRIVSTEIYPMVRGRLVAINGVPVKEIKEKDNALRRELNLSWTETLAPDNRILEGEWWDKVNEGVSVEVELAARLNLSLGDQLRFSVGGLTIEAPVASFRSLNWNSMRPNFYMLFAPGTLEDFPATYITSFYLPPEQKLLINDLVREFPSVSVIELDKIIQSIRDTIGQVSLAIESVLVLMLVAGVLVLLAGVRASISERLQEAAIIRTLGGRRRLLLQSLILEFGLLGAAAGMLAAIGAEATLAVLAQRVFELPLTFHPQLWLLGPLAGALLVGTAGTLACRRSVSQPPLRVLRELA